MKRLNEWMDDHGCLALIAVNVGIFGGVILLIIVWVALAEIHPDLGWVAAAVLTASIAWHRYNKNLDSERQRRDLEMKVEQWALMRETALLDRFPDAEVEDIPEWAHGYPLTKKQRAWLTDWDRKNPRPDHPMPPKTSGRKRDDQ